MYYPHIRQMELIWNKEYLLFHENKEKSPWKSLIQTYSNF